MKGKLSIGLHLAALLVVAVWAWVVFSSPETEESKGRVVLDVEKEDLHKLVYDGGRKKVEAVPRKPDGFTLRITETVHKPAPTDKKTSPEDKKPDAEKAGAATPDGGTPADGGSAGGDGEEPAPMSTETNVSSYRASSEFGRALERLLPLVAERTLGRLEADKLEEFGLADAERTLTVESRGQSVSFAVGDASYGGATTYVRQLPGGPVYLISSSLLRSIDIRPPRFMERGLIGAKRQAIEAIQVATLTSERELIRKGEGRQATWVAADSPDTANALFANWVNNLLRLGAEEYLGDEDVPPMNNQATVTFRKGDETLDVLELAAAKAEEDKKDYYARSKHTGTWVRVRRTQAENVVSDIGTILQKD